MTDLFKSIRHVDEVTFYWLFRFTRWWRDSSLALWVSRSGDGPYYVLVLAIIVTLAVEGSVTFMQRTLIGFAIELPLFWWLKNTLRRARPAMDRISFRPAIKPADRFSFPSGHATAAFLFAGLAAASFPAWALLYYMWAGLVALARVSLGVHFPSDIIAGAVLGSGIAYFVLQMPI
ncbi:phosphatase PAP2 family protein [Aliidiomarina minuta]|uniref:undecaprenyl-diphosphate phosphatase n=1 Tax=Aliidiomarina minuta TaxID=880057 RepID=A0A432W7U3_9GAMM|nr:phosphatase PAP2 family protein [Aliidiomarina minuta]RUO26154.1 phosphatase PAP2 family protein [Aliidiomarina minuta]